MVAPLRRVIVKRTEEAFQSADAITRQWKEIGYVRPTDLRQRYNDDVLVIFIHGRKAFKYRIDPRQFLKRLQDSHALGDS
jgi:hypothetical protein